MDINNDSFWVSNPDDLSLLKFWPCSKASTESNMNRLTVLVFYISIISALLSKNYNPLYFGILSVAGIALIYYTKYAPVEGMENFKLTVPGDPNVNRLREPTPNNPFMNVSLTDYDKPQKYNNYNRYKEVVYPTPESENIRKQVSNDFIGKLFQNPSGKLFDRNNSQREFISQSVGEVPSRQNEFAQWLYGKDYVCKSGSIWDRYGVKHTPDSLVCNGFNASSPTNFGIKEKF